MLVLQPPLPHDGVSDGDRPPSPHVHQAVLSLSVHLIATLPSVPLCVDRLSLPRPKQSAELDLPCVPSLELSLGVPLVSVPHI